MKVDENDKIEAIHIPKIKFGELEESYIPSEQSANVLFKFMTKSKYLKETISHKAVIPRYYEENISYLNITGYESIAYPMICFCDIHLNKLIPHMEFYGSYGIGLSKRWGISKGVQPIHYINHSSNLISDYSYVFSKSLEMQEEERMKISEYNNYLLTYLLFIKPLTGKMFRNNEYVNRNFHDEREWRYIPNLIKEKTELPLIIPKEQMIPKAYDLYSNGFLKCEELWLKFNYEDIKYIMVKDNEDRNDIIRFIMDDIQSEDEERLLLISKILVFDNLREDW